MENQNKSESTFPEEGAFAMIQYLPRDKGVVDHLVVLHAAEAAVFHTVVQLILQQRALQEATHPVHGLMCVLKSKHSNSFNHFMFFFLTWCV